MRKYTALRHLDFPSNPCAANWFPCFQEKRHRPARHGKNLSSFASDFNHTINKCFQIFENISLAICFLSCFSANACRSSRARVSVSSSRVARVSLRHFGHVFNKLKSVRHVAGANFAQISCCAGEKVPAHTRGCVAATCPSNTSRQLFHKRANSATCPFHMSLLHSPATYPVIVYLRRFFPATFCSNMFLQHVPSCGPTFSFR